MSLKESLRRRQIRNYGYVRSDIICKPDEIKQRYQEAQNLKNSPESKQDEIRRSTLKKLDKATKYLNEQKIKNYLEFFNNTLKIFIDEYNAIENKSETNLKKLIKNYNTHIKKLIIFDNEEEFNNTTYTQNLGELFAEKICALNPLFIKILTPKQNNVSL